MYLLCILSNEEEAGPKNKEKVKTYNILTFDLIQINDTDILNTELVNSKSNILPTVSKLKNEYFKMIN